MLLSSRCLHKVWRSTPLEELCLLQLILEDQEIHTVRLQRKTPGRKQKKKLSFGQAPGGKAVFSAIGSKELFS